MAKNIYVGNLSFEATAADLEAAFGAHGTVQKAQIVTDRETGRSRGFAFVEMSEGGDAAIQALNGTQLGGRTLTVNEAKPARGSAPIRRRWRRWSRRLRRWPGPLLTAIRL